MKMVFHTSVLGLLLLLQACATQRTAPIAAPKACRVTLTVPAEPAEEVVSTALAGLPALQLNLTPGVHLNGQPGFRVLDLRVHNREALQQFKQDLASCGLPITTMTIEEEQP